MIEDGDDGLLFFHEPIIEINPHQLGLLQCAEESLGLLERFLVFLGRIGVGDNPGTDLQVSLPPHHTRVRITILRSRSPFQPMYPNDPV